MNKRPLIFIGLDGLSWKIYKMLNGHNSLFLNSLFNNGTTSSLISSVPPTTGVSWTSIFTGVNPGKHGIFGFFKFDMLSRTFRLANGYDVKSNTLWQILSEFGYKRQLVINIPISTPFKPFDGMGIPDWLSPVPQIFHRNVPRDLVNFVIKNKDNLLRFSGKSWWVMRGGGIDALRRLVDDLEIKVNMYIELIERWDWDSIIMVISETDWFQHLAYLQLISKDSETMNQFWRMFGIIDNLVKSIYSKYGNEALYVFASDHGFRGYKKAFFLNKVFLRNGLLKTSLPIRLVYSNIYTYKLASQISILLQKIFGVNQGAFSSFINYKESLVFAPEDASALGIRINRLMARRIGVQPKKLRQEILNFMVRLNRKYKIFSLLAPREHVYWGPYTRFAPDIVFLPNMRKGIWVYPSMSYSYVKKEYFGHHSMEGIFAMYDSSNKIALNENIKHLSVLDVLPAILYLLDLEIPKHLDGKRPEEIFQM